MRCTGKSNVLYVVLCTCIRGAIGARTAAASSTIVIVTFIAAAIVVTTGVRLIIKPENIRVILVVTPMVARERRRVGSWARITN